MSSGGVLGGVASLSSSEQSGAGRSRRAFSDSEAVGGKFCSRSWGRGEVAELSVGGAASLNFRRNSASKPRLTQFETTAQVSKLKHRTVREVTCPTVSDRRRASDTLVCSIQGPAVGPKIVRPNVWLRDFACLGKLQTGSSSNFATRLWFRIQLQASSTFEQVGPKFRFRNFARGCRFGA